LLYLCMFLRPRLAALFPYTTLFRSVCLASVTLSPVTPGTVTQRALSHQVNPPPTNSSPTTTHNATSRLPRQRRGSTPVAFGSSAPDRDVGSPGSARVP